MEEYLQPWAVKVGEWFQGQKDTVLTWWTSLSPDEQHNYTLAGVVLASILFAIFVDLWSQGRKEKAKKKEEAEDKALDNFDKFLQSDALKQSCPPDEKWEASSFLHRDVHGMDLLNTVNELLKNQLPAGELLEKLLKAQQEGSTKFLNEQQSAHTRLMDQLANTAANGFKALQVIHDASQAAANKLFDAQHTAHLAALKQVTDTSMTAVKTVQSCHDANYERVYDLAAKVVDLHGDMDTLLGHFHSLVENVLKEGLQKETSHLEEANAILKTALSGSLVVVNNSEEAQQHKDDFDENDGH